MNEKDFMADELRNTLIIVNSKGRMCILKAPFSVLCIQEVVGIPSNTKVFVNQVYSPEYNKLQYIIFGRLHFHSNFKLPDF
jgi:hypothetical protein